MTSKEALEKISNHKCYVKESSCYDRLKELYKNEIEKLEENLERLEELEKELDIFKLAFYTLWKSTNSSDVSEDKIEDCYIEFRVGYESVCVPVSEQELDNLSKACELLDIFVREA